MMSEFFIFVYSKHNRKEKVKTEKSEKEIERKRVARLRTTLHLKWETRFNECAENPKQTQKQRNNNVDRDPESTGCISLGLGIKRFPPGP